MEGLQPTIDIGGNNGIVVASQVDSPPAADVK